MQSELMELKSTLQNQPPVARCDFCGNPQVVAICHHCGKRMCAQHGPALVNLPGITENREFYGIPLGVAPLEKTTAAHCKDCVHSTLNYRTLLMAPGVILLGLAALLFLTTTGSAIGCFSQLAPNVQAQATALPELLRAIPNISAGTSYCYSWQAARILWQFGQIFMLFLLSAAFVWSGRRLDKYRIQQDKSEFEGSFGRLVPLGPFSSDARIVESLESTLTLTPEGDVVLQSEPLTGKLQLGLRFTNADAQRIQKHAQKFGGGIEDWHYHAGYLLLLGRADLNLRLLKGSGVQPKKQKEKRPPIPNLLEFVGQIHAGQMQPGQSSLFESIAYTTAVNLANSPGWGVLPLRIVPVMERSGSVVRVSLEIQLNSAAFLKAAHLNAEQAQDLRIQIEQVRVEIPTEQGKPETEALLDIVGEGENRRFRILWQNLYIKLTEQRYMLPGSIVFKNAYEKPAPICGEVSLVVPLLFSGLEGMTYFSALGQPSKMLRAKDVTRSTRVICKFQLALQEIPATRWLNHNDTLPKAGESSQTANLTELTYTVAPTPERLQQLMRVIEGDSDGSHQNHVNVRYVLQDLPHPSEKDTHQKRWRWDVSGRIYQGMHFADFHIVLYGSGNNQTGESRCHLNVQGQGFDEIGVKLIEDTRLMLKNKIDSVLIIGKK